MAGCRGGVAPPQRASRKRVAAVQQLCIWTARLWKCEDPPVGPPKFVHSGVEILTDIMVKDSLEVAEFMSLITRDDEEAGSGGFWARHTVHTYMPAFDLHAGYTDTVVPVRPVVSQRGREPGPQAHPPSPRGAGAGVQPCRLRFRPCRRSSCRRA